MMSMKKTLWKRFAAVAIAAIMMAAGMPAVAIAEGEAIIDTSRSVSLTLTKYLAKEGDTTELDSNVSGEQQTVTDRTPLAGVEFTAEKFADLIQENDGNQVNLKYKLTNGGAIMLSREGTSYHQNQEVSIDILKNFISNKTARDSAISFGSSSVKVTTDENGVAKFVSSVDELPGGAETDYVKLLQGGQGLYLVVETKATANVTQRTHPFFVSLPMSDKSNLDQWLYDVYAYPKNATQDIEVDKEIYAVNGDESEENIAADRHSGEADIGDVITYRIPFTMPMPDGSTVTKLGITDTMCKGLTFKKAGANATKTDVTVNRKDDMDQYEKVAEANYNVTATVNASTGITTLTVTFISAYLTQLSNGTDRLPQFEIIYSAVLNENAVMGNMGNENNVKLVYQTKDASEQESEEKATTVYTWGIDLLKVGESDAPLQDVQFELANGDDTLTFKGKGTNSYIPSTGTGSSKTLTTNSDGTLRIEGLKSGTYYLTEVKTAKGYVLLKEPVQIVITGNNEDGSATATVSGKEAVVSDITVDGNTSRTALVNVKIVNGRGFLLPSTGGAGTTIFTIVGVVVIVLSLALLIMQKKRELNK